MKLSWYESRRVVVKAARCDFFGVALRAGTLTEARTSRINFGSRPVWATLAYRVCRGGRAHATFAFRFLMFLRSIPACLARSRNALKFHNKLIQRQAAPARPISTSLARLAPSLFHHPQPATSSNHINANYFHQTKSLYHQNNSISSSKWLVPSRQLVSTSKYYCTCRIALHSWP